MCRSFRFMLLVLLLGVLAGPDSSRAGNAIEQAPLEDGIYAVLHTDLGSITVRLYYREAPLMVANFVGLAEGTRSILDPKTGGEIEKRFYDDLTFHRVIQGFMIQTGDPTGQGNGNPGYRIRDEIVPELRHDQPGTVSMANSGPGTTGSQFFITERATPWLDGKNSVFGRVVQGMDVVLAISSVPTEKEKPVKDVHLQKVEILRRGKDARNFDAESIFAKLKDLNPQEIEDFRARRFQAKIEALRRDSHKTKDGGWYAIVSRSKGEKPQNGSVIYVHYVCYLPDGKVVESTRRSSRPMKLVAGEPRRGLDWELQFLDMKPGELRWVLVPAASAFGHRGIPGVVPPDSDVIFQLELVDRSEESTSPNP